MSSQKLVLMNNNMPNTWCLMSISEVRCKHSDSFNPNKEQNRLIQLFSVPSHATGVPELIFTSEIGSNKQYVKPNQVLLSKINPRLNRVWVVSSKNIYDQIASTEWIVFEHKEYISPQFLKYLLETYPVRDYLSHNASGVGGSLTRVKPILLDTITFGLPPLNEQRRIVAKIEELFSELDSAESSLKLALDQLHLYRQSLLKSAFEGKLTAKWREQQGAQLESAETLLERISAERTARFEAEVAEWEAGGQKGQKPRPPKELPPISEEESAELPPLPANWKWKILYEISEISGGVTKNSKRERLPIKRPYLRVANVYANRLELGEIHQIGLNESELERITLKENDLLIVEGNGSVEQIGRVALWNGSIDGCVHQNHLIKARFGSYIQPKFILYFLMSPLGRKFIVQQASSTSGLHTLSLSKVAVLFIPLCPITEQIEIITILDAQISILDVVDQDIQTNLSQVQLLRQSILKKAFAGELVPQDPNDEPASVLLERIRAERANQPSDKTIQEKT